MKPQPAATPNGADRAVPHHGLRENNRMKKRFKILVILVASAGLFFAGFCAGMIADMMKNVITMANFSIAQTAFRMDTLAKLDKGNLDQVRSNLNLEIDTEILGFGPLINWEQPGKKGLWAINDLFAIKVLKKRAKQCKESNIKPEDNDGQKFISDFLEKADAYNLSTNTPQGGTSNSRAPSAPVVGGR